MMVATERLDRELRNRGFANTLLWSRGVDAGMFHPSRGGNCHIRGRFSLGRTGRCREEFAGVPRSGVAGDQARGGRRSGAELAVLFAGADVFAFPSRTDTFGLVILEALAAGTPMAAFPVAGPLDVIGKANPAVGALDEDLQAARLAALEIDRAECRRFAEQYPWESCARLFWTHLTPIGSLSLSALG